ncbi:hypothetical protein D3C86_1200430 [compost metagenome]
MQGLDHDRAHGVREAVEPPEMRLAGCDRPLHLRAVAGVARHGQGLGAELGDEGRERLGAPPHQGHPVAALDQAPGECRANAAACADDEKGGGGHGALLCWAFRCPSWGRSLGEASCMGTEGR